MPSFVSFSPSPALSPLPHSLSLSLSLTHTPTHTHTGTHPLSPPNHTVNVYSLDHKVSVRVQLWLASTLQSWLCSLLGPAASASDSWFSWQGCRVTPKAAQGLSVGLGVLGRVWDKEEHLPGPLAPEAELRVLGKRLRHAAELAGASKRQQLLPDRQELQNPKD